MCKHQNDSGEVVLFRSYEMRGPELCTAYSSLEGLAVPNHPTFGGISFDGVQVYKPTDLAPPSFITLPPFAHLKSLKAAQHVSPEDSLWLVVCRVLPFSLFACQLYGENDRL
jgi:hypothetical protein